MNMERIRDLIYQGIETEIGGINVYEAALRCVKDEKLKGEWETYLDETKEHVRVYRDLCDKLEIDPEKESIGRQIVRAKAEALVGAMETALERDPDSAQLVAAECVVDIETKDHLNWELIGEAAGTRESDEAKAMRAAHQKVEDQEDRHLYHTMGWTRELWLDSLELPAVLPPPEEEQDVDTAMGAALAKQQRKGKLRMKRTRGPRRARVQARR